MASILETYSHFVFDFDRTIAPNNENVTPSIAGHLRALIEHAHVAIVTSRSIHDGLELLAQTFFQNKSPYSLYFFTTTAAQAYLYEPNGGGLLKLYDKAKGDANFQYFLQDHLQIFNKHGIEVVDEICVNHDSADRQVRVDNRAAQLTLFFSSSELRNEFSSLLLSMKIHFIHHGRNTLHVLPDGVSKRLAIEYLRDTGDERFLIFADGFFEDHELENYGNDIALTQFPPELVTCINVGKYAAKVGSKALYPSDSELVESDLTDHLLREVLSSSSLMDLKLCEA